MAKFYSKILTQRWGTRKKKEKEKKKQSSDYFFVTFAKNKAPLHSTPQNAILEHNFRCLL